MLLAQLPIDIYSNAIDLSYFYSKRLDRENELNNWILLFIAIIAEIFGTTMLKQSNGFTLPIPTLCAMSAFTVAFYLVSRVFLVLPVGIVYAIWSGVGIVVTALIGWLVFGQKPDMPALLGMGLIVAGAVVINLFSQSEL